MLLRYADKRIVNIIMKVYIERNNLQPESIRYHKFFFTLFTLIHIRKFQTQHFGSVSDSLGRLMAASQCMAGSYIFVHVPGVVDPSPSRPPPSSLPWYFHVHYFYY